MVTVDCSDGLWPKNKGLDLEQDLEVAYDEIHLYLSLRKNGQMKTRIQAAVPIAS